MVYVQHGESLEPVFEDHYHWHLAGKSNIKNYGIKGLKCEHSVLVRQSTLKPQLLVIAKTKELSEDLRATIVTSHKDGLSYKAIAKHFHVPIPTIQFIVKKYKTFYTVSTLKGRGRKLKVDPRLARKLVIQVADNPRITSKELLD